MTAEQLAERQPPLTDGGDAAIAWLRRMRDAHPVHFDELSKSWFVYRHEDATAILSDPATYSSEVFRLTPGGKVGKGNLTYTDPPRHRKLRQLVTQAFTPKVIAGAIAPAIIQITERLLDKAAAEGGLDLIGGLALPLPVMVIADLLGVPSSDHKLIAGWATALLGIKFDFDVADAGFAASVEDVQRDMNAYLDEHIAARAKSPRDDLISHLIAAEVDGERLDADELRNFAALLLLAGHVTTTALVGNTWLCLEQNPRVRQEVRDDPSLFPQMIEEVMRYRPSLTLMARVPTASVTLHGRTIPPNCMLWISLLSVNRDERRFPDPDVFDIHRTDRHHLSFGHGIHYCLGAALGKQEATIVINTLLERFPQVRRSSAGALEFWETPGVFAPKRLELSF
jgi:cytochrome P450